MDGQQKKRLAGWGRCLFVLLLAGWAAGCDEDVGAPSAQHVMVAAAHPLAVQAGLKVLSKNGNAMDAAVTVSTMLSVAEPHSSGLGGGGFLLHYDHQSDEVTVYDFREKAPGALKPWEEGAYEDHEFAYSGLSVGVPGLVRGLVDAHEKHGRLDFKDLLRPAILAAEEGVPMIEKVKEAVSENATLLYRDRLASELFFDSKKGGGKPKKRLKQRALGVTLRGIALNGADAVYGPKAAEQTARRVREAGGVMTAKDLMDYRSTIREPVRGAYRNLEIVTMGPPSAGGVIVLQALKLLDRYDLSRWNPGSPEHLALVVRAHELAARFSYEHVADPDQIDVHLKSLLSEEWVNLALPRMPFPPGASPDAGSPEAARAYDSSPDIASTESPGNTTHFSIVDGEGNMVSLTQTVNYPFGSGLMVLDQGILLNNELYDFTFDDKSVNRPGPGKIPRSNMSPMLVFDNGRPVGVLGTPGGPRIPSSLIQILVQIADYDRPLQKALDAPRVFYHRGRRSLAYESRISKKTMEAVVGQLGGDTFLYELDRKEAFDKYFGGAHGVWISRDQSGHRKLEGGADPRRNGIASGF